jgi:AcrR family transcriptional regulator
MSLKIIEIAEKIVTEEGIDSLNVCKILRELNITNRVFYNRFNNIEDVLNEVYNNIILQIRVSL